MVEREVNVSVNVDFDNDGKIDKSAKKTVGNVKQIGDESKKTSGLVGGISGQFQKLAGVGGAMASSLVGGLTKVATGFKGIGAAIALSGIGLLVTLIGALVAAFKRSEEGQNKFAKIMGVIGAVMGVLLDRLAGLGEALISAIENPQKAWDSFVNALKSGFEFVKDQVITRFLANWTILTKGVEAGILLMRIKWNEFTGDSSEAAKLTDELEKVKTEIGEAAKEIERVNKAVVDSFNAVKNAITGIIDEAQREARIAAEIADKRARADKIDRELLVARAKAERDINELRFKNEQRELFTAEERIKFLQEAQKIRDDITRREIAAAALRLQSIQAENELGKSNKEALDEEARLKARLIELDSQRLSQNKELERQIRAARDEQKAIEEEERKKKEEEAKAIQEAELAERSKEADERLKLFKEEQAERERIAQEQAQQEKAIEEAKFNFKQGLENATLDILGKNSKIGKAFGIAQASRNTWVGVTETFRSKSLLPEPLATISKIANAALILKSGLSAVSNIRKVPDTGVGGDTSGSLSTGSAPQTPIAPPSFNIIGNSQGNQIADALSANPIKAFVVSKEVTSGQELDRNTLTTASFG